MSSFLEEIHEALMEGETDKVKEFIEEALAAGVSPQVLLKEGLMDGMNAISQKFKNAQFWIPDVLMASRAMHAGLHALQPVLANEQRNTIGKVVIGTVAGDLHDIGKNMVIMMLQGARFEVIDIGIDVPAEGFVQAIKEHKPDILGITALLTTTMPEMPIVIEALNKAGLRHRVKIIVGGGPVTAQFANKIGADAYAVDALTAVDIVSELLSDNIPID